MLNTDVPFMLSANTAVLAHRKPTSSATGAVLSDTMKGTPVANVVGTGVECA
jgi:hypothetical protein